MLMVAALFTILISLFVWHGSLSPDPESNIYPGERELIRDHHGYIGEKVEVGGRVISESPLTIEVKYGGETMELFVTGTDAKVREGDRLTVFGTLQEDNIVTASKVVVQPFLNIVYMYLVSIVAALWVLSRILTQWRWNHRDKALEPRERPGNLRESISRFFAGGEHG